jgi:hypothetical protein
MKTRTRISGPLFFGFSDPITMRALAGLYAKEELAALVSGDAALSGDAAPGESPARDLERFVARLRRDVDGLGEHAAIALARTTSLSRYLDEEETFPSNARLEISEPRRLTSVAEVARVARVGNGERVREFLESDLSISESTRRWPAWRARIVPKIVHALRAIALEAQETVSPPSAVLAQEPRNRAGAAATAKGKPARADEAENVPPVGV